MQQDLSTQRAQAQRMEELLHMVAAFPDAQARATTEELIGTLLDMHGQGLARLLELVAQAPTSGPALVERLADDELVESLLLLHGLHPRTLEERVTCTLNEIQAYLKRHGAQTTLLRVEDGIAYLQLASSNHGCSSTLASLETKVVETLNEAVPDLEDVRVEHAQPSAHSQRITFVPPRRSRSHTPAASAVGEQVASEE